MDSPLEQHSGMVVTRILPVPCPTHTMATSACSSLTSTSQGTAPYKMQGGASRILTGCVASMEDIFRMITQDSRVGNLWHWVNYGPEEGGRCWACRPGRWGEGVREFSCKDNLNFACERNREFPVPIPPRPDAYDPTPPQLNTCKSCQVRGQRRIRQRMRLRFRGLRRLGRRRINPYFHTFLY